MTRILNKDVYFDIANGDVSVTIVSGEFVDACVNKCGEMWSYDADEKDEFLEWLGATWEEVLEITEIKDTNLVDDSVDILMEGGDVIRIPLDGWREHLDATKLTDAQKWIAYRKVNFHRWQRNQMKAFEMFGRYPHQLNVEETLKWEEACFK